MSLTRQWIRLFSFREITPSAPPLTTLLRSAQFTSPTLAMHLTRHLQPALAALLAACVLLLGLAGASPALHDAVCTHRGESAAHEHSRPDSHAAHDHADDAAHPTGPLEHICAITLFAAGCDSPAPPLFLVEPALNATRLAHFTEFMLARTLRGPARVCGPPALA